jgi:hypothetical protein
MLDSRAGRSGVGVTVEMGDECNRRLEEVERWASSLPPEVIGMERVTLEEGVTVLAFSPLRNPKAALFDLHFLPTEFHVHAGRGTERIDSLYSDWRELPCSESPLEYCEAIVSGGLTETEYVRQGKVVKLRTELRLGDTTEASTTWNGCGCLALPWTRAARWDEVRTIHYPAYWEEPGPASGDAAG